VIVDSGVLYASMDADDQWHERALDVLRLREPKFVTEPIVVETSWLVERRLGVAAELAFLDGLSGPALVVESVRHEDRARAVEVLERYREAGLGYVDATTIAIAERLGEPRIATTDRGDFSIVRPRHVAAFDLIP
jgi:hypothetical protein